MQIILDKVSKRYGYHWIFKEVDLDFATGTVMGVMGRNGSGKSTLMKIISGFLSPTEGKVRYSYQGKAVKISDIYKLVNWVAPYVSLTENYTIEEMYNLQSEFKKMKTESFAHFLDIINLSGHQNKYIKDFSSGMQQRLQLGLAILSQTPLLLLDEPTSYLDKHAISWYHSLLQNNIEDRIVIIASNDEEDLSECNSYMDILDYK